MPNTYDPRRRCLPLAEWPAADRDAWGRALAAARVRFSARGPAARFAAATLDKAREGYGRWLGFLQREGWLDPAEAPTDRVTPDRAAAYFDALRALGNADHTILGRFQELASALRIMGPQLDTGWLHRPGGVPLRQQLAMARRPKAIHHSRLLYEWGLDLMETSQALGGARRRQVMLRDGLLIGLLASRAMRLRSLLAMRLGQQLRRDADGHWSVALEAADVKTGRAIDYPLPRSLNPWMERYVTVERVELLAGRHHDAVWINWGAAPLGEAGLEKRIRWWSAKRFGPDGVFGPHHFRYCLATTAPIVDPLAPGASAAVLGISASVHREHYDRGRRAAAAGRFLETLTRDRHASGPLARNLFVDQNETSRDVPVTAAGDGAA